MRKGFGTQMRGADRDISTYCWEVYPGSEIWPTSAWAI